MSQQSEFEISIKTKADLKAAQESKRELESQITAAKKLGQDSSQLESKLKSVDAALNSQAAGAARATSAKGQASKATQQLSKAQEELRDKLSAVLGQVPGLEKLAETLTGMANGSVVGVAAGFGLIAAAVAAAAHGVAEFAQAEKGTAKLDAALAQSGQLSDDYRERLQALAGQLQDLTGVSDDAWTDVLTRLTQFGATADTIDAAADAVKNLAGILGGDLNQSAAMVSRALQGNFDMFGRLGIHVNEHGTQVEKLNQLYEQLTLRGGGQLEASSRTLIGLFGRLKNAVSDFFEAIGQNISKTGKLQDLLSRLTVTFAFLAEKLGGPIDKLNGLKNAAQKTTEALDGNSRSADAFKAQQDRIKAAVQETTTALNEQLQVLVEISEAQDRITDAEMALELAKVKRSHNRKQISDDQALEQETAIRKKFAEKKFNNAQALNREVIDSASGEIADLDAQYFREQEDFKRKRQLLAKVQKVEQLKSRFEQTKGEIESREARVNELTKLQSQPVPREEREPNRVALLHEQAKLKAAQDRLPKIRAELLEANAALPFGTPTASDLQKQIDKEPSLREREQSDDAKRRRALTKTIEAAQRKMDANKREFGVTQQTMDVELDASKAELQERRREQEERRSQQEQRKGEAEARRRRQQLKSGSRGHGHRADVGETEDFDLMAGLSIDTAPAAKAIERATEKTSGELNKLNSATVEGFEVLASVVAQNTRQIQAITNNLAITNSRLANLRNT